MSIRNAQDSFVKYLSDNITIAPVNVLRRDVTRPDGETLQMNAVNLSFLNNDLQISVSGMVVVIDVVNDDEYSAINVMQKVWELLSARFFTPKLDYSDPSNPLSSGTNMFWDSKAVHFTKVYSDYYTHFTCRLPFFHHV